MPTVSSAETRGQLDALVSEAAANAFLVLCWRAQSPNYRVETVETAADVGAHFLTYARATTQWLVEASEVTYDPEWILRENEFFAIDELPVTDLFDQLADFQSLSAFHRRALTKPRLYVVAVQAEGQLALFGKRMGNLRVLKQKSGIFAAVWDGSTFNTLTDSVATFSESYDWVLWQGVLHVIDASAFHAEFRDTAALRTAVSANVASITNRVPIVNADEMIARCQSSVPMASKLNRIAQRGLQLTSTPEQLKQYAQTYGIDVAWHGDSLVFDGSLEGQWNILKLLDEDRTEGPLSHRHYESAAKREI
jgi:hypothetical protein